MPFADVGVILGSLRQGQTYHYRLPDELLTSVAPGQLLFIPFGRSYRRGWLLSLLDAVPSSVVAEIGASEADVRTHAGSDDRPLPEPRIKTVARLLCQTPLFTEAQLTVARQIARHYRCSVGSFLSRTLPAGLLDSHAGDLVPSATGSSAHDVTNRWPESRPLVDMLAAGKTATPEAVAAVLPAEAQAAWVAAVVVAGLATLNRGTALPPRRAEPARRSRLLRLRTAADAEPSAALWSGPSCSPGDVTGLAAGLRRVDAGGARCEEHVHDVAPDPSCLLSEQPVILLPTPAAMLLPAIIAERPSPDVLSPAGEAAVVHFLAVRRACHEQAKTQLDDDDCTPCAPTLPADATPSLSHATKQASRREPVEDAPVPTLRSGAARLQEARGAVSAYLFANPAPVPATVLCRATGIRRSTLRSLIDSGMLEEVAKADDTVVDAATVGAPEDGQQLGRETRRAMSAIFADMANRRASVFLLDGRPPRVELVTQLARRCRSLGRQALVLVSDLKRGDELVTALARRVAGSDTAFPLVAALHSRQKPADRLGVWQRLWTSPPTVLVGARLALLAPLPAVGAIVLFDEERESYTWERAPRYHAREVALCYARQHRATLVLVSDTPDPVTYWRAKRGVYRGFTLPIGSLASVVADVHAPHHPSEPTKRHVSRAARAATAFISPRPGTGLPDLADHGDVSRISPHRGAGLATVLAQIGDGDRTQRSAGTATKLLPIATEPAPVDVVDLRHELRMANTTTLSRRLQTVLRQILTAGGQALLLLNRRGAHTQLFCVRCGYVARCEHCTVTLTYHAEEETLLCHYCNARRTPPGSCPVCPGRRLSYVGAGTQRVERDLRQAFPSARIARLDRDVSPSPRADGAIVRQFTAGQLDVLVGTRLLVDSALPSVALAAMLNADVALHLPDYHAAERTFALLELFRQQVKPGGQFVIQTYQPDHWAIQAVAQNDHALFYQEELRQRRALGYPPYADLVRVRYTHVDAQACKLAAEALAARLEARRRELGLHGASVVGPAPAFVERVRDRVRWQLFLRGRDLAPLLDDVPASWAIDVDPATTL